jgi:UPF0716 protein FxsA
MWLFLAFLAIPLIEIGLFIQVGGAIGLWPTLGIVVLTAILGTWLVRAQGSLAMNNLRQSFSRLEDPAEPLAHGAMILVSGALLLTPGFFTDAVGFALLVPGVRSVVFNWVRSRVHVQHFEMGPSGATHTRQTDNGIIDGEFTEVDQDAPKVPGSSGWTKH